VTHGVRFCDLAAEAGFRHNTLSDYLAGRLSSPGGQVRITEAFCRLTGQRVTVVDFWGELLSKRIAS